MTARERMFALRIIEKAEKNPEYVQKLGLTATLRNTGTKGREWRDNNA